VAEKQLMFHESSASGNRRQFLEAILQYDRRFGDHSVGGTLKYTQDEYVNTQSTAGYDWLPNRHMGLAGRITYGWKYRYMVDFNFGYNGSENFAPDNQFGFFPAYYLLINLSIIHIRSIVISPIIRISTFKKLQIRETSSQSLPGTLGLSYLTPSANVGKVRSTGFDGNVAFKQDIGNVSLTVRGNFTYSNKLTKYSGYDPEFSYESNPTGNSYGADFGEQATLKSFIIGASINF